MQERINIRFLPKREKLETLQREYPDFKPHYIEAIQALFQLSVDLEKEIERFHLKNGFTRSKYLVLMVLLHEDDQRLTPNEIAQRMCVTRGNMTSVIDGLVKEGYVKKFADAKDRRKVWIQMTPKAEKFIRKIMPGYFKRLAKFMSAISKKEIDDLISISRKLNSAIGAFTE